MTKSAWAKKHNKLFHRARNSLSKDIWHFQKLNPRIGAIAKNKKFLLTNSENSFLMPMKSKKVKTNKQTQQYSCKTIHICSLKRKQREGAVDEGHFSSFFDIPLGWPKNVQSQMEKSVTYHLIEQNVLAFNWCTKFCKKL